MADASSMEALVGKRGKSAGVRARFANLSDREVVFAVQSAVDPQAVGMALASMAAGGDTLYIGFAHHSTLLRRRRLLEALTELDGVTLIADPAFTAFFDNPDPSTLPQTYFLVSRFAESHGPRNVFCRWSASCADTLPKAVTRFLHAEDDGDKCWLSLGSLVMTVAESRHVMSFVESAIRFSATLEGWPRSLHIVNASGSRAVSLCGFGMRFSGTTSPTEVAQTLDLVGPGTFEYVFPQASLVEDSPYSWTASSVARILDANDTPHGWPEPKMLEQGGDQPRALPRDWLAVLDLYPWQFVSAEFHQRVTLEPPELHGGLALLDLSQSDSDAIETLRSKLGHAIALGPEALAEQVPFPPWLL